MTTEANRGAEAQKTARDGAVGTSKGGIKSFFKEISDYVDRAISRSRFIENPTISDEHFDDLPIGQISENDVNKLKREYGIDLSGYNHVLSDNDIRHIYNRHGPHTNERLPVTAEDIKNIPTIIRDADDIYFLPRDDGKKGLMYRYESGDTTYYLEEILESEGVLRNKQMIKVPSGEVPNIKGLQEAINKKSIKSAPDDAAIAVPQMYAQGVRIDANNSIPTSQPIVNEKSAAVVQEALPLAAPDLDAARETEPRYLPTAEEIENGQASYGRSFDELAQISTRGETERDRNARHGSFASNGWNYRTAYFEDSDGTYYKVRISIAQGENGNIVYNIGSIEKEDFPQRMTRKSGSEALGRKSSDTYDTTTARDVNREIEEPRYLPTAEEIENGQASYGRSFDEFAEEARYLPTAEEILAEDTAAPASGGEEQAKKYLEKHDAAFILRDGAVSARADV